MPLDDMVRCTLAKHGLSTAMELRRYFKAVGTTEDTVSKQAYLKQRKKLNFEVFKYLNGNYLKREPVAKPGWFCTGSSSFSG